MYPAPPWPPLCRQSCRRIPEERCKTSLPWCKINNIYQIYLTILNVRIFLFLMLTCHSIIKSTSSLWFISSPLWMTIINISVQILTSISSVLCLNILPTYKITSSPTLIIKSIPSYPVIWLATALNTVQDWEAKFSCKKMFSLLCCFLLRLRLTLSQIFSKRFVHCIAGKAQVGIVISDLEVKPKQPEQ